MTTTSVLRHNPFAPLENVSAPVGNALTACQNVLALPGNPVATFKAFDNWFRMAQLPRGNMQAFVKNPNVFFAPIWGRTGVREFDGGKSTYYITQYNRTENGVVTDAIVGLVAVLTYKDNSCDVAVCDAEVATQAGFDLVALRDKILPADWKAIPLFVADPEADVSDNAQTLPVDETRQEVRDAASTLEPPAEDEDTAPEAELQVEALAAVIAPAGRGRSRKSKSDPFGQP